MISVENASNMQEREGVEEMRKMEREVAAKDAEEMEERRGMAREVAVSEAGGVGER